MMKAAAVLAIVFTLAVTAAAHADYYRYRDASGTVNYTNDLNSIPKPLRARAVVVAKDAPEKAERAPAAVSAPAETVPLPAASAPGAPAVPEGGFFKRYGGKVFAVAGCILLVLFAGKAVTVIGWGGVRILRAAAVASLLAYFAFTHFHNMLGVFGKVRKDLKAVQAPQAKNPVPEDLLETVPAASPGDRAARP